ncbi:PREDICTED: TBC1 domain family member 15 isoform X1 [Rhagoletis zephyria]|uniref:TBC1 domain family member 15 isoform X1 n=2 Tax=Rhagoletis zephyria TaxID=28612 RepID=UPI0008116E23|nr:PREDICTED: TBC1 domain family member 15 isoform X1 [Rhagoletis zephyria]XP_017475373.1 PREDICTED: TBC1 domain family member 15 isoform X1 [Rhagoletis zephyria]XP_017475374.1 PREDICTED: TBC1 domain family member 15 isoform X1 [Rhagoletis zephyria]
MISGVHDNQELQHGTDESQNAAEFINGTIMCTHDGVLLRKASVEHITYLNTSGSLSIIGYDTPHRLFIEWRPNDNILIADDSQDWAVVDTIPRRSRTISECKAFNIKPTTETTTVKSPRLIRNQLDELGAILVKHRGQVLCFIHKCDYSVHSEFFFQHGNADQFVKSMCDLHIIEYSFTQDGCTEYIVLNMETQKLKRTFAELNIDDMKNMESKKEKGWVKNTWSGLLVNLPDLASGVKGSSPRNYSMRQQPTTRNAAKYSGSSSEDQSPVEAELENLKEVDEKIVNTLPERPCAQRSKPLNESQWLEFQSADGGIRDTSRVKEIIFHGGIHYNLRAEVWKYLLNYYRWNDSEVERIQHHKNKYKEYYKMKAQWLSMTTTQEENFSGFRDRKCQIEKDVKRTDRSLQFFAGEDNPNLTVLHGILMTYVMYNFDLGYVQGMSDLLAPILSIQGNEVDAFWCFVGFMDMVFANFDIDQAGMKTQFRQLRRLVEFSNPRLFNYLVAHDSDNMFFCFRWLLVWYKREFSNEDVLKLWECLWTRFPCPNFHLFISVSILDKETDIIIENKYEFTEILKHINELSGRIDVKDTLEIAEALYLQIKAVEDLPNDIRQIIGEPHLVSEQDKEFHENIVEHDLSDEMYELVHKPEEERRHEEQFDEACERSMFLNYT